MTTPVSLSFSRSWERTKKIILVTSDLYILYENISCILTFSAARRICPDVIPVVVVLVVEVSPVMVRVAMVREGAPVRRLALPQLLRSGLGRTLPSATRWEELVVRWFNTGPPDNASFQPPT